MPLQIDNERRNQPETGINVRARNSLGGWEWIDVAALNKPSLLEWLKSKGGDNLYAENVVGILLGHGPFHNVVDQTKPETCAM
jgi:hypothetical protein